MGCGVDEAFACLGSMGALKGSDAEAERIICLDDGWNLTKRSFFFVSFSQWKIRVSSAFVFIRSRASTWCKIETWRRSRLFGAAPAGLFLLVGLLLLLVKLGELLLAEVEHQSRHCGEGYAGSGVDRNNLVNCRCLVRLSSLYKGYVLLGQPKATS